MTSALRSLSGPGKPLREEAPDAREFQSFVRAASTHLRDAGNRHLASESRFLLIYNAAHALCLAALRYHGYRPTNRYIVFQVLPHTLGLGPEIWMVLTRAHEVRNLSEYQGESRVDAQLLTELLVATKRVAAAVDKLPALK